MRSSRVYLGCDPRMICSSASVGSGAIARRQWVASLLDATTATTIVVLLVQAIDVTLDHFDVVISRRP